MNHIFLLMIFLAHCWRGIKAQIYRYASVLDIEECATETDNCHVDANCTNTKGSFYCTCHTGYSGDGVRCIGMRCSTFMVATTAVAHKVLSHLKLSIRICV